MMTAAAGGGYRITHQLIREPLRLGFCSKLSLVVESAVEGRRRNPRRQWRTSPPSPAVGSSSAVAVRCIGSKCCHGELSVLSDSFSQKGDGLGVSSDASTSVTGGVVALGKFDALHIGHRELAVQASKIGTPFLLSLVGMAEVLGWQPR